MLLVIEQTQPSFQNILSISPKLGFLHFSRHDGRREVRDLPKFYPKASDLVGRSVVSMLRLTDSFRVSSSEAHKWIRIVQFIELLGYDFATFTSNFSSSPVCVGEKTRRKNVLMAWRQRMARIQRGVVIRIYPEHAH